MAGQYLGFAAILVVALAAAFGATFLPESAVPHLGLLPLPWGSRPPGRRGRATAAAGATTRPSPLIAIGLLILIEGGVFAL